MAIYVLNADLAVPRSGAIEQRLRTAIPDLIAVNNVENALHGLQPLDAPNYLLLIAPPSDAESIDKLAETAARYRDRIFFVLIGGDISASQYKSLVRTGGADWISAGADVQEVLHLISSRQQRGRTEATAAKPQSGRRVPWWLIRRNRPKLRFGCPS